MIVWPAPLACAPIPTTTSSWTTTRRARVHQSGGRPARRGSSWSLRGGHGGLVWPTSTAGLGPRRPPRGPGAPQRPRRGMKVLGTSTPATRQPQHGASGGLPTRSGTRACRRGSAGRGRRRPLVRVLRPDSTASFSTRRRSQCGHPPLAPTLYADGYAASTPIEQGAPRSAHALNPARRCALLRDAADVLSPSRAATATTPQRLRRRRRLPAPHVDRRTPRRSGTSSTA